MTTALAPNRPGILVVDDHKYLLEMLEGILVKRGFQVWACSSGKEAIHLFREHSRHICLVLLDVRMPELDGPQTLEELRKIDSNFHACFMSGFLGNHQLDDLLAMGVIHFFEKPVQTPGITDTLWNLANSDLNHRRTA